MAPVSPTDTWFFFAPENERAMDLKDGVLANDLDWINDGF